GSRISIVDDTPGVTRDRVYYETEWNGRELLVIDTGGIEPVTDNILLKQMRAQAQIAIDIADVIVFMCELHTGVTAADRDIAAMLKKSGKNIILAVNKVDTIGELPSEFYEFYELGFDDPVAVSSLHGTGSGDILDIAVSMLPEDDGEAVEDESIGVAVIGKPNAGKSSLINRIMGEERVIV
ncbi:MAG TPA: ribosome biogenesis GTPase Der, partial [Clostridiales bacterium]|nr:ribosome biogenesis GTPase Der [Clostridiales bacterium]